MARKHLACGLLLFLTACGSSNDNSTLSNSSSSTSGDKLGTTTPVEGSTDPVTISNTATSAEELKAGDLLLLELKEVESLAFKKVDPDAEFVLVISNVAATQGNFSVQINNNLTEVSLQISKEMMGEELDAGEGSVESEEGSPDITELFHDALREREKMLITAETPTELSLAKSASGFSYAISDGDKETFKVLSTISSASTYIDVTATAECVRDGFVFYLDSRVTGDMLAETQLVSLCDQFDATFERQIDLFGPIPDLDKNGKLMVLFTPGVNNLGASGGGLITGFFTANDLYPAISSNAASNEGEILYVVVPDPKGKYGVPISTSFAMNNLLPPVVVHEMQHLQNYNQHVLKRKGSVEEPWLNEGLSHLAEDLLGQNQENASRYAIFLKSPSSYPLVTSTSPGIGSRGASYLFLRYLYEQHPDGDVFIQNLLRTSLRGIQNVETAFGGSESSFDQFGEFQLRWNVALALTDKNITNDSRYTYRKREYNATTSQYSGVCLVCDADDGRNTVLGGVSQSALIGMQSVTIKPTTSRFYKVGADDDIDFRQFGSSGGDGFGTLIRLK